MTYQELWDVAYAIGYHRGRMRAQQKGCGADRAAFDALLNRIPTDWTNAATKAHNLGITDGDR